MRMLLAIMLLSLYGCTTTVTVQKPVFPDIPAELIVVPKDPIPLPPGNIGTKEALTIIVPNNILAAQNAAQLKALIEWLNKTSTNINGKRD